MISANPPDEMDTLPPFIVRQFILFPDIVTFPPFMVTLPPVASPSNVTSPPSTKNASGFSDDVTAQRPVTLSFALPFMTTGFENAVRTAYLSVKLPSVMTN